MNDLPDTPPPIGPDEALQRAIQLRDQTLSHALAVWLVGPLATLLVGLILVFFVFFDSSTVTGPSMLPTLRDHDYVLLTKGLTDPQRGDIVIIDVIDDGVPEEWVKRVVALPGDVVDFAGDTITVNGTSDLAQFRHLITQSDATRPLGHVTVPAGRVFVAGDNRGLSRDSRYVGTFPISAIKGRVVFIYAPIWRMGPVPAPAR